MRSARCRHASQPRSLAQKSADFADDVVVVRPLLHGRGSPCMCIRQTAHRRRQRLQRAGSPQRVDVVDHLRAGSERRAHHRRLAGVDRHRHRRAAQAFDAPAARAPAPRARRQAARRAASTRRRCRECRRPRPSVAARARARHRDARMRPPSEKESGVTLTMPMTSGAATNRIGSEPQWRNMQNRYKTQDARCKENARNSM